MSGRDDRLLAEARAWAERTAAEQRLPLHLVRPEILRDIAGLLGLAAPDRDKPLGVKPVQSLPPGVDGEVVENGGDDRGLAA